MKNYHQKIRTMVRTALMISLCCVATMVIRIPSPTGGYANMGDCFVLLSAWMLGPVYGAVAAGTGSALADLLAGYAYYVPATFIIKSCMAVVAALVWKTLKTRTKSSGFIARAVSIIPAQTIMVLGYLVFNSIIRGKGAAALASVPGDLMQSGFALVASLGLSQLLAGTKQMEP